MERREFLGLGCAAVAVVALTGFPTVASADAKEDAKKAENAKKALAEVKKMFGTDATTASDKVILKAPDIAENGMAVPITVSTEMADAKRIAVYIDSNPDTFSASWSVIKGTVPEYSTRVKMGGTGVVMVVVEGADGKLYTASKEVKVTVGGCGG
jgi:sulfur-oxidizing protein SoxY